MSLSAIVIRVTPTQWGRTVVDVDVDPREQSNPHTVGKNTIPSIRTYGHIKSYQLYQFLKNHISLQE